MSVNGVGKQTVRISFNYLTAIISSPRISLYILVTELRIVNLYPAGTKSD